MSKTIEKYKFYVNVKLIRGYNASCVMDLQREKYHLINNQYTTSLYKKEFEKDEVDLEIFDFLLEEELIYEIEDFDIFLTDLSNDYTSASLITNAILEIDSINYLNEHLVNHFNNLGINAIQIIIINEISLDKLSKYLSLFDNSRVKNIELILNFNELISADTCKNLQLSYLRLKLITVTNSPYKSRLFELNKFNIFFVKSDFSLTNNFVSKDTFYSNMDLFLEAINHNPYLNKKIFVTKDGFIKNAPETNDIMGILPTDLTKLIKENNNLNSNWNVSKDKIDVCNICEFRYMCVDNRIPIMRNKKEWFMETECNYNPYISKWNNEGGYKTLFECGLKSSSEGFIINQQKIDEINKELWCND